MNESVDPKLLRDAMFAYVRTFPTKSRLDKHITYENLDHLRELITKELDATLKTAEDFLFDYPGGVPWTKEFEVEFEGKMRSAHPWLDAGAMARVMNFSRWLCWHDGLNRRT